MSTFSTAAPPRRASIARRLGAGTATAALVAAGVIGLGGAAHADEVTHTFWGTSGTNWTVPAGVHSIHVEVVGASGGGGDILEIPIIGLPLSGDGAGGGGDRVTATLDVTPGDTLRFYGSTEGGPVGERHSPGDGGIGYRNGGDGNTGSLLAMAGGGGGGASAVVAGDRLIVAGGGGGGGGRGAGFAGCYGGHGGNAGMNGVGAFGVCAGGGHGGLFGVRGTGHGTDGGNAGSSSSGGGGGGGGGGYRGGLGGDGSRVGGAGGGGGGGGSSYASAGIDATFSTHTTRGDGYVRITYDPTFGTSTDLVADPAESVYGQPVTYSVSVGSDDTSDTPQGQVNLFHGARLLGTADLVDGEATFHGIRLDVGATQVQAEYVPSTSDFYGSTGTVDVTVDPGSTTTTLQVQPQRVVVGQPVTVTANVAPVSPAAGTITGEVEFSRDGQVLGSASISDGVASLEFAAGDAGSEDISATYLGTPRFGTSDAVARSIAIERGSTLTEIDSTPNPTVRGQEVTLEASVHTLPPAVADPTGEVQFYVDGAPVGEPEPVQDGAASLVTADMPVGAREVTAEYSGDGNLHPSVSDEHLHAVDRANAEVTLTVDPTATRYGQVADLTADVRVLEPGQAPVAGSVEFFAGEDSLGTAQVVPQVEDDGHLPQSEITLLQEQSDHGQAILPVADLEVGDHVLTAVYSGNEDVTPAASEEVVLEVSTAQALVTVTSDPEMTVVGQETQLRATVDADHESELLPTGLVGFEVDGEPLGDPVELHEGVAVLTVGDLEVGDREIVAIYQGDRGHAPAVSEVALHAVDPGRTTTALTLSSAEITTDDSVELSAEIGVVEPARGTPAGSVQFYLDGTAAGDPVELNSPAVLELDSLEVGTYAVHAQYSGEDSFQPSVSQEIELTVTAPASPAEDGFRGGALSGTHRPGADLPGTGLPGHLAGAAAVGMLLILTGAVLNGRRQHS